MRKGQCWTMRCSGKGPSQRCQGQKPLVQLRLDGGKELGYTAESIPDHETGTNAQVERSLSTRKGEEVQRNTPVALKDDY